MTAFINTFSGRVINLAAVHADDIDIGDIAHALSLLCRFNGHCRSFYSVAQHSVWVSLLLEGLAADYGQSEHAQELCLMGLLHDAAEAYPPGDIAGPLKRLLEQEYGEDGLNALDIQRGFNDAIVGHFGLAAPFENAWSLVELADRMMLAWEWRDLMNREPIEGISAPHTEESLDPWDAAYAEIRFLHRFQELWPTHPLMEALLRLRPDDRFGEMIVREAQRLGDAAAKPSFTSPQMNPRRPEAVLSLPVRRKGEEEVDEAQTPDDGAIPMDQGRDQQRKRKKKKHKKHRKGFTAEDVERMIAAAIEARALDSMSAPKRGAPGSSPDCPQPLPRPQNLRPTAAEQAAMDDPRTRKREAAKVEGAGGRGIAAYE